MTLQQRIQLLADLGNYLSLHDTELSACMLRAYHQNRWFSIENQEKAIAAIAQKMLRREALMEWLRRYKLTMYAKQKTIGLVLAGNIPLVGWHDVMCVFVSGNKSQIKLSDKDSILMPFLIKKMIEIDPAAADYFEIVERLGDYDAVIATGSNNSARYFEAYFGKKPHIIRKNRNSIAILSGNETQADFAKLGDDIFDYFGLGCRNISKLYLPEGYVFEPLLEGLHEFREIVHHDKYKNNFDYNFALFILNKIPHQANGCILMREEKVIASRIASLHYEFYNNVELLENELLTKADEIQCVVTHLPLKNIATIDFGKAQQPELWDYADGVDTLEFLMQLK
jgi:Acyl-CoA reductase (LuxC)